MLQVNGSSKAFENESLSVCCSPVLGVWHLLSSEVQCGDTYLKVWLVD